MKISSQLKGCIYEVNFRYNANLDGYTTLMSYIPKLSAISCYRRNINESK